MQEGSIEGATCGKCYKGQLKIRNYFGVGTGKYFPMLEIYKCDNCGKETIVEVPPTVRKDFRWNTP